MTESAKERAFGAEISERSTELVLPETASPGTREPVHEREIGVNNPEASDGRETDSARSSTRESTQPSTQILPGTPISAEPRGIALPGDRGREPQRIAKQRPSFWRRIALGRRGTNANEDILTMNPQIPASATPLDNPATRRQATDSLEKIIVEPLLQALVSVESKLERSHVELTERSEEIEKQLSQLWDIDEQLGTLTVMQDSLLQLSEQQRQLKTTIASQNRILRWLVGGVFFSLAVAAFIMAADLR
jgi:hypothetical protein